MIFGQSRGNFRGGGAKEGLALDIQRSIPHQWNDCRMYLAYDMY